MSEIIHNGGDQMGDDSNDVDEIFKKLEQSDALGPLHEKEKLFNNAREALLLQFEALAIGEGGQSLDDALEIYNALLDDTCVRFHELVSFSFDYIGQEQFVPYFAHRFIEDEKFRYDRMLMAVQSDDANEITLELITYEDAETLAEVYKQAKLEQDNPDTYAQNTTDDKYLSPEELFEWIESQYYESVSNAFYELEEFLPKNIHDNAKQLLLELAQEKEEKDLQRRKKIADFLTHVVASVVGTGLTIGTSRLIKKFKR